jgi:hypothetical protein
MRTDRVEALTGATLAGPDPAALAQRWAEVLGRPCKPARDEGFEIALEEGGRLRFERATSPADEGLVAVRLRARDPEAVRTAAVACGLAGAPGEIRLGGVRVELESA